ncbi:MAG: tRNA (adenosine(37)-N6)-threonylcarbamoyltransferase complex transferase subunit TsaD [Patescibacteria group bacterium]
MKTILDRQRRTRVKKSGTWILAIETSCDETAVAIARASKGMFDLKSHVVASQVDIHRKTGGVVPEVAAREHAMTLAPVIEEALTQSKATLKDIDIFAVTAGPGLSPALMVGVETAKMLAGFHHAAFLPMNHMEGHIVANWIPNKGKTVPKIPFPAVVLTVSGGHTELILMTGFGKYRLLGRTVDDAAGEAFDKVAKHMGLPYPGGPQISKLAAQGNVEAIKLPRPMLDRDDFSFSFSGLKTAVLYATDKKPGWKKNMHYKKDLAASFEQAVVDVLVKKTVRAAKKYKAKSVLIGGGVAANKRLRKELEAAVKKETSAKYFQPKLEFATDNAAMIAAAAALGEPRRKRVALTPHGGKNSKRLFADPNWELV